MKPAVLFLLGLGLIAPAAAQNGSAQVDLLPIPKTMPDLLFAPDPLAGAMLRPLIEPEDEAIPNSGSVTEAEGDMPENGAAGTDSAADAQAQAETPAEPPLAAIPPDAAQPPPAGGESAAEAPLEPPADTTAAVPPAGAPPAEAPAEPPETAAVPPPDAPPPAGEEPGSRITVIVENVTTDSGTVNVAVCDKALSREGCPYDIAVPAAAGFVEAKFDGIPPGTYAVVGYHDVNGNDEFDKFLGVPREPYALSSAAAESLVPSFSDAALPINQGDNVVIIRLRNFGG